LKTVAAEPICGENGGFNTYIIHFIQLILMVILPDIKYMSKINDVTSLITSLLIKLYTC
jgi:hypothetical protein